MQMGPATLAAEGADGRGGSDLADLVRREALSESLRVDYSAR